MFRSFDFFNTFNTASSSLAALNMGRVCVSGFFSAPIVQVCVSRYTPQEEEAPTELDRQCHGRFWRIYGDKGMPWLD